MKLSAIVAMAKNRVIGKENRLPWNIPADLKYFKTVTSGHPVIMGRKTHESIGRLLPGRKNVIITRQSNYQVVDASVVSSLEQAIQECQDQNQSPSQSEDEVFIIGGAEIYTQALPLIDRLYLTQIHQNVDGDAFFPEIPMNRFKETSRQDFQEPLPFSFLVLDRVS